MMEHLRISFYAMSDETRLKILALLYRYKKLCVCQIQPIFGISQPNLSFHLRILRDANLVNTEKKGKWVYYSLNMDNPVLKKNLDFIKEIKLDQEDKNIISCEI